MFGKYSHTMFYVLDVSRTVIWYIEKLGFQELFITEYYGSVRHKVSGTRIDFHKMSHTDLSRPFPATPHFFCSDLDASVASLLEVGIMAEPVRSEGGGPRFSSFKDCEGNVIGLVEQPSTANP